MCFHLLNVRQIKQPILKLRITKMSWFIFEELKIVFFDKKLNKSLFILILKQNAF